MNSVFSNSEDRIDTNVIFTKLKELLPSVKKVESITILKEFTELEYKDDEMDVKFEFISPHTVKITYQGDRFVRIEDEGFDITLGNYTEDEAMLDYICYLDFLWERYAEEKVTNISDDLKEKINTIKSQVTKI